MKIRTNFVSNSSSSSYIITIRTDIKTFYNMLFTEYGNWDFLCKEEIIPKIKESIERYKKSIKEMKEEKDEEKKKHNKFFLETYPGDLEHEEYLLEKVTELKDIELTEFLFKEYYRLDITENFDDEIQIQADTSMHNDFDGSMGHILKEIALFFMFDTKIKIKGMRIDTQ